MKIAYFHYLLGESTALHHVRQFVEAVRELGHEISVHPMNLAHSMTSSNGNLKNQLREALKKRFSRVLHEPKELLWNVRYFNKELEIVRREIPDVILTRNTFLNGSSIAAAKWSGMPLVLEVNAPASESKTYFDQYMHLPLVGELIERFSLKSADQIVAVSKALREHFHHAYGIPNEKITVNPNGADCERFIPGKNNAEMKAKLGISGKIVIGYVGSLHPWHGPDILKAVIENLSNKTDVAFLLVGGGSGWSEFEDWLTSKDLRRSVCCPGAVQHRDIPDYLSAMDIALMPDSNFYGSPLKVIEYMAAGLPTVAPSYGPLNELIEDGVDGVLFPPRDIHSAMQGIDSLVRDEPLRRQLGVKAAMKVRARFTWRHNAERVMHACQLALSRKGLRPR